VTASALNRQPIPFARAVLAWLGGAVATVLSLPVVVLMTPFWLIAAATRKAASLLEGSTVEWFEIIEPDGELGWRLRPDLSVRVRDSVGEPFSVTTDPEGWRGSTGIDDADIVVIGDSFAFGHAVDDSAFFPTRVPGSVVKALGAPGYSMVHMLLLTRRLADRLQDKHVVWFAYEGNDLDDSLKPEMDGYRVPFVRRNGEGMWAIEDTHMSTDRWRIPSPLLAHEALVEISMPTLLADRVREASRFLVDQGREICRGAGARFSVALVPDLSEVSTRRIAGTLATHPDAGRYDAAAPDRLMQDVCAELGVPYLSLRRHLTAHDYRADDVHWNRRGNARVARALAAHHASTTGQA
jgi:hypothetical protein